ncbi:hypothetical protein IF1G_09197 [Cordyceps javanica]|uniref:Uncharacterized protein n=1 Tax=Cordyceps javanica TaxID=43265 RepID=A0A545VQT1_9HYPO|nr:hypothetical protein IF1G_09197 [Cordyceps javanica]TQW04091.1 hypothetical protein IF2G_08405 [Cordyceps javanica]
MVSLLAAVTFLLGPWAHAAFAAHAGFHVQFPWMTRGPNPKTRPELDRYNPFCSHPGDLVTALYAKHRVPRKRDDFQHLIFKDVPIQPSGQLCVNVTIPFETVPGETGVMYFEASDPKTGTVEYHCSDVKMVDLGMDALPEDHLAMCAANNETLIPMPDEYL